MKEKLFVQRIIEKIIELFNKKTEEEKIEESNRLKREMCERAIKANVCPKSCNICAWHVR